MTTSGESDLDLVRRRVINVVGHELRTPITTIRGLADLLADASPDELADTLIPALIRNARRAERLLDDLLIASDIATALPTDPAVPLDLTPIVTELAHEFDLVVDGAPDAPVLAHRKLVLDTLYHLVDNAKQYGTGAPLVSFDADDGSVIINVTTPVEREVPDLDLSFELFYRGELAVTRAAGLGIGLPVARSLARLDGGDVTIDQVSGFISTHLLLPRAS